MYPHLRLNQLEKTLLNLSFGQKPEIPAWNERSWQRFFERCRANRVSEIVFTQLKSVAADGIPTQIYARFQKRYRKSAARNWSQRLALQELDAACLKAGHEVLVFRGPALRHFLYPDPGHRPSVDLDLMPRRQDPDFKSVLIDLGYRQSSRRPNLFRRRPVEIDLHQDVANIYLYPGYGRVFQYRPLALWQRALKFENMKATYVLDRPDDFNFLALHLAKHSFDQLIWWLDLYRFLVQTDLVVLEEALDRARRIRLQAITGWVLSYLKVVFPELNLPECPRPRSGIQNWLFERMLQGGRLHSTGMLLFLSEVPSFGDKIRFILEKFRGPKKEKHL